MFTQVFAKIFGTANERKLKKLTPIVAQINSFEPEIKSLSDEQLSAKTNEFRERLAHGQTLDDLLPEAFAVVREAARRTLGQRHYDVQLMGAIVLHQGRIAEMKTGEGKTLTATLPLYLNALGGKGAHLVTVNDYLARRDSQWMAPVFERLGLTVGCLQHEMSDAERKAQYQSDIMYATNNELGFDYLRDNMKFRLDDYVQRALNYAIVDEVDSILIDEARTPLIISGGSSGASKLYGEADHAVRSLKKDQDYEVDEKERAVHLTEAGNDRIEAFFNIENLYAIENLKILHHAKQALKAHVIFKRDVDYVVADDKVMIVDEFTGRILSGRRYSDGLHQAIEAKEGVKIESESHTLASITLQNFFRLYQKLAGMTGTALTEAEEFFNIYKLDCVAVPTNVPVIRDDKPDMIFLGKPAKYKAILEDVLERHKKGQPVLIGTVAIETSELLSNLLKQQGIPHEVLNAKQHVREAEIVEHAGEPGHITIATNMAGRGTDIKLMPQSKQAGGLAVIGTERHEARRIDNQLRGRSGRQGDPGDSRFYISLEDDLMRRFGGDNMRNTMQFWGMKEDEVIESRVVSKQIQRAQEKVERFNFENRKYLIEYDDVLNQQRIVIYRFRREALEGAEQIYFIIRDLIGLVLQDCIAAHMPTRDMHQDQFEAVIKDIAAITGISEKEIFNERLSKNNTDELKRDLNNFLLEKYQLYRGSFEDKDKPETAEKWVLLETIDQAWKQHMINLEHLKEGISLRSWGQKNPLIEYKREAFAMFQDMMHAIRRDIVFALFRVSIQQFNAADIERRREAELDQLQLGGRARSAVKPSVEPRRVEEKIGRNDPCPCGSGRKYKKCCGAAQ